MQLILSHENGSKIINLNPDSEELQSSGDFQPVSTFLCGFGSMVSERSIFDGRSR